MSTYIVLHCNTECKYKNKKNGGGIPHTPCKPAASKLATGTKGIYPYSSEVTS